MLNKFINIIFVETKNNNMKLSKKNYQRIPTETFKSWITEIMKEPTMRYANAAVVAVEIEKRYGGMAKSHLHKIRAMRIDVKDFLTFK